MLLRQLSDPIFNQSKDAVVPQTASGSDAKFADVSHLQSTDAEAMLGEACGDDQHKQLDIAAQSFSDASWLFENSSQESGLQFSEHHCSCGAGLQCASPVKKPRQKACKGQRARYRKLVDQLFQQIRDDPSGIDFDKMQLPPAVAENAWLKNKLMIRLMQEQSRVLKTTSTATHEGLAGMHASEREV